jgi:hypothetical protein
MRFVKFTGYKGEWSWLGSTLNPYYEGNSPSEMIDDDRFVRGSYGNWEFGINDDGDLMSWLNLQQIPITTSNKSIIINHLTRTVSLVVWI